MIKKYKYILLPVLVLFLITVIAGLLLGLFSEITHVSEAELKQRVEKKLANVYHDDQGFTEVEFESANKDVKDKIEYFYQAKTNKDVYIAVVNSTERGYGGTVQMFVVFEGNFIIKMEKGSMSESPGISDQAFAESFFSRFYNIDVTTISGFTIDGGNGDCEVDGVSGATYSSKAVVSAVTNAVTFYKEFKEAA